MKQITYIFMFTLLLGGGLVQAAPLQKELAKLVKANGPASGAAEIVLAVGEFIGDAEQEAIDAGSMQTIAGRETEADEILDTLVRMKSRVPVLVAPPGVGKTAVVQRAVQKTLLKDFPQSEAFTEVLDKAHWIQLTSGALMRIMKNNNEMSRMKAIEDFFDAVAAVEKAIGINIIVFRDEFHTLDKAQIEALLPYLESQTKSVRLVGASNGNKMTLEFGDNEAILRRIKQIPVTEFDDETTLELVKQAWIPKIESKYDVKLAPDALKRLVRFGTQLNPDGGKFDGAIKFAQDLAIWNQRHAKKTILDQEDVFQFYKDKTRFPVDPFNKAELHQYLRDLEDKISSSLVGQGRMVRDTVEIFRDVILGTKKDMGVIALVGPSGTGKSELGKKLASLGFNNPRSFLKIDCNEYQSDDLSMNKLFGAAGGLVTSNSRVGILPEYFDDPSQGKYGGVILLDEAEKAHPKFWQRLMEFFEEGTFRGGDNRIRRARRHVVILTSNRGDTILFPESMRTLEKARIAAHGDSIDEKDIKKLFQIRMSGEDEFNVPTPVLNRIDRWSISVPLHADDVSQISDNFTVGQIAAIEDHFQVKMRVQPEITRRVGGIAFDPQYGARPVERALTRFFNDIKDKMLASPANFKGQKIDVVEDVKSEDEAEAVVTANGKEIFRIELPRLELDEPLLSTTLAETVSRVNTILPARVIGQEDATTRVKDVVVTYLSTPRKKRRVLSIMLLGLTGVGKTETAKAIAEAVYGRPERAEVVPMGEIQNEADYNRIVGSPPGYVGSDKIRAFERALMNHPEGGVIVLDEFTNVGGNRIDEKNALIKKLYNIIEEGKWTSAATNETYDLTKYIFVMTGNDGEELFQGNSSDVLRLTTWKKANKPAALHRMLVKKGVPEAFLGRMADIIMMKPLLRKETERIANKLISPLWERFKALGYRVDLPPEFDADFGQRFFTQQKGARSLRAMAEVNMNTLLAEAVMLAKEKVDLKTAKDKWIKVEFSDNLTPEPYIEDPKYEAKVEMRVRVGTGAKELADLTRNVTAFAALDKKLSKKQAEATAYHEAGHAIMNDPEITGTDLRYLTILGSEGNLGFALYDDDDAPHRYRSTDRKVVETIMARLLGGQVAMVMAMHTPDAGWGSDLEKARSLARKFVLDWALNNELLGLVTDEKGRPVYSEKQINRASKSMEKIMNHAIDQAVKVLTERWDLVEMTAKALLTTGSLDQDQFTALRDEWKAKFAAGPVAVPPQKDCASLLQAMD